MIVRVKLLEVAAANGIEMIMTDMIKNRPLQERSNFVYILYRND